VVALVVAWLSLSLAPLGVQKVTSILNQQDAMTEFDTLEPGRFQSLRDNSRVTYTERLSADRSQLGGVFISERNTSTAGGKDRGVGVLVADTGRQEIHPDGSRYLILQNGFRYDGVPGQADYRAVQYDTYGVLLPKPAVSEDISERDAVTTGELMSSNELQYRGELQWRLSLPILVFVVTLIAVPLAKVNPRQGRFLKLLPAILLYMAYLSLLIAARGALDKGRLPPAIGLWGVHLLFLVLGLLLAFWEPLKARLRGHKPEVAA
jgi:lipopolysaccharide export system permease protein